MAKKKKQKVEYPTISTANYARFLEIFDGLLDSFREDIESGLEDGVYLEKDNVENLALIKEADELLEKMKSETIEVLVYVEGGAVQGASATRPLNFKLFDKDNLDGCSGEEEEKEFYENFGTPEEWEAMIETRTENKEIIPVF